MCTSMRKYSSGHNYIYIFVHVHVHVHNNALVGFQVYGRVGIGLDFMMRYTTHEPCASLKHSSLSHKPCCYNNWTSKVSEERTGVMTMRGKALRKWMCFSLTISFHCAELLFILSSALSSV